MIGSPSKTADSGKADPTFSRTFLVYGLGSVSRRLVGLLLIPIYTRLLSPSDYGVLSLLGVFMAVYLNLADLGISVSILRFYIREKDEDDRRQVLSACLNILALAAIPTLVAGAATPVISRALLDDSKLWFLVAISMATGYLDLLMKVPMAPISSRQDSGLYVRIKLILTGMTLALSIFLVAFLKMGVLGVVLAQALTNGLAAAWLLSRYIPHPLPRPTRATMKSILRYGLPFVPSGLSQFVLRLADRYILKLFESMAVVGLYSVGYRLGEGLSTAADAFWMAWVPFAHRTAREDGGRRRLAEVGTTWFGLTILMAILLSLFSSEALRILTPPSYHAAARVVPVVAIGLAFFSFYPVAEVSLQISGRTGRIPIVNGAAAALNVALNFILIPRMHILGAAWATAIAYGVQFIGILWLGQRCFAIPFPYGRMFAAATVALATGIVGVEVDHRLALLPAIGAKALLFCIVVWVVVLLRLVSVGRIRRLMDSVRRA
jgi:O-antigen/teichoic acid export membrane protein